MVGAVPVEGTDGVLAGRGGGRGSGGGPGRRGGGGVKNKKDCSAAGFYGRLDRGGERGCWKRDLALALLVAIGIGLAGAFAAARAGGARLGGVVEARAKDPGNRFVENDLHLLSEASDSGKAIE